ncbi:MAG: T9SS type A sorting domain-containing protein [Bacteroidales bacterium]|nr:T9SS type A sorting domain-containing protein [Bacteroidales bacterium]
MKHFISFLVTVVIFVTSFAQNDTRTIDWEWAPIGAVWMYANSNMDFENPENIGFGGSVYWFVQSVKDTVNNGIACRKLETFRYQAPSYQPVKMPARYTYQDGGDIYFYNNNIDDFTLAFSYDLNYRDTVTWISPYFEDIYCNYYLDTILNWDAGFLSGANTPYMPYGAFLHSNIPISTYRLYYTEPCVNTLICGYLGYPESLNNLGHGMLIDYVGPRQNLSVISIGGEGTEQSFRCYCDGNVKISEANSYPEEYVSGYAQDSCVNYFYRNFINNIETSKTENKFFISPNPATNFLHINSQSKISFSYKIYNTQGGLIKNSNKVYKENTNIDIRDLKQGIYLIHFDTSSVRVVKKFIKL